MPNTVVWIYFWSSISYFIHSFMYFWSEIIILFKIHCSYDFSGQEKSWNVFFLLFCSERQIFEECEQNSHQTSSWSLLLKSIALMVEYQIKIRMQLQKGSFPIVPRFQVIWWKSAVCLYSSSLPQIATLKVNLHFLTTCDMYLVSPKLLLLQQICTFLPQVYLAFSLWFKENFSKKNLFFCKERK